MKKELTTDEHRLTQMEKGGKKLPEGWEWKKLGDVCEVIPGQSPKSKFYNKNGDGLPFYQGKKEFTEKYIDSPKIWTTNITKEAQKDDILMSVRAPVGPVNFATQRICIGRGLSAIRAGKTIRRNFLFYYLIKHKNEIIGNDGAVFNSINRDQIKAIKIPLPPLAEQKRIVAILDEAFAAIDKVKINAEKNLANARELFESYLNGVFANPGEDWEEKKLGEVFKIKPPKKQVKEKLNENDEISFVPMECLNVNDRNLTLNQTRTLKDVYSGYTYFENNDVLLAKITPCFENGKIGIARNLKNGIGFGSSEFIVLRTQDKVIPEYLYYYLSRESFRQEGKAMMAGAVGHKRVQKEFINEYQLPFPESKQEQKRIVNQLDKLSAETKNLESIYQQKITALEELKKSILKKAFEGDL